MKKRSRINSERNGLHCLYYRRRLVGQDGSVICATCLAHPEFKDIIKYHCTTCEDFEEDPKNPVPKYTPTDEEKEAESYLRKRYSSKGKRAIRVKRGKEYPKPKVTQALVPWRKSSRLVGNPEKQSIQAEILSDNIEVRKLLDRLFKLERRSKGEGRKIRRQLRKLGFYLSKKGE